MTRLHVQQWMPAFQAPIACLCIASLFVTGCRSGREQVSINKPDQAFVADDGSLLMCLFVERELQADRSGWHWVIVEPQVAAVLLGQAPRDPEDDTRYPVYVAWQGKDPKATIVPPLLEKGLAEPTVPTPFAGLKRVQIGSEDGVYRVVNQVAGEAGESGPAFTIQPSFATYHSSGKKVLDKAGEIIALPFLLVGAVIVVVWLGWYLATDDSGLSPI